MKTLVTRFAQDESAATAIEYGLIAAGISVAIIAIVQGIGTKLANAFTSVSSKL
jgi:pilus assembly protein Flp/PilA